MTEDSRPNLHDAAVAYAAAGWRVFPLSTRGGRKAPLFPSPHDGPGHGCQGQCGRLGHGFYDATSAADTVSAWWTRYPDALIGARIEHHLLVLDVDPRGGGDDTLARLEAEHGPLPATLTCYSGRGDGGRHLYLLRPRTPGWALTGVRLRPGIDLVHRTLRYTVLPPSPHPATGQPYRWHHPVLPPAVPPVWLTHLVTPPRPPDLPTIRPTVRGCGSVAGLVNKVLRQKVGGRHDTTLWALYRAYEQNAADAQIEAICQAAVAVGKPRSEVDAMKAYAEAKVQP